MATSKGSIHLNAMLLRSAVSELLQRVKATVSDPDPAPWYDAPVYEEVEFWAEGDEAGFVHRKKLEQLAKAKLKIALLSGDLVAQFSDGAENRDVPGWAWHEIRLHDSYWFDSRIPIDPFLPDDWYRWSGHEISLDRRALNDWLAQADLASVGEPPVFPEPHDDAKKPLHISARLPRDSAFVTISEAVSWVAFGISMDQGRLSLALEGKGIDPTEARRNVSAAMAKLADRGTGGSIAMRGKYVPTYLTDDRLVQTVSIDPVQLADFAKFDILHDGLAFGDGLAWIGEQSSFYDVFNGRDDSYRGVTVNRAELLNAFPAGDVIERPAVATTFTAGAENECRTWLSGEFAADPEKQRTKAKFRSAALAKFSGRLSVRGFNRAWDAVAPCAGRSKPG